MLYLNDQDLRKRPIDWHALADVMLKTLRLVSQGKIAQPIKPYLRFKHPQNRIIAMPAYVGGDIDMAGIKWIASFPDNPRAGLPRAHSVIVLNDADTGRPEVLINSPLPSIARTAAVSGLMMRTFLKQRQLLDQINLGIIGWGPIGQHHARMAAALFGNLIASLRIFDLKEIDASTIPPELREKTIISRHWGDVYHKSNIFITCTVSEERYIDSTPPEGALLLNVSLRDYKPAAVSQLSAVIVDDWNEVCRENTDIELLHREHGLTQPDTRTLADAVLGDCLQQFPADAPIFFNPMGMAVFDIAAAAYFTERARVHNLGLELP